jgi:hypothetical protein
MGINMMWNLFTSIRSIFKWYFLLNIPFDIKINSIPSISLYFIWAKKLIKWYFCSNFKEKRNIESSI